MKSHEKSAFYFDKLLVDPSVYILVFYELLLSLSFPLYKKHFSIGRWFRHNARLPSLGLPSLALIKTKIKGLLPKSLTMDKTAIKSFSKKLFEFKIKVE